MPEREQLELAIRKAIDAATDESALETVRVAALGKKGSISALLSQLGTLSPHDRKRQGAAVNALKDNVLNALNARRAILKEAALEKALAHEALDVTLPVQESGITSGRIHPISQVIDELTAIFTDMGFSIAEGPDIETDDYNFTKLNFPPGICTTHFSLRLTRPASGRFCARIPVPCRSVPC
jgi:phenylalanyl-tRNA synthetase alpha chain